MYKRNRLLERWDSSGNLQLCKMHSKTNNENLGVLRRTVKQQGQIQSHSDTHGNIKNTRSCIMQVLNIKGLYKDLYCCNWEKSQPFCKKKILPVSKREEPKNLSGLFDCLLQSDYFHWCYNFMPTCWASSNQQDQQIIQIKKKISDSNTIIKSRN